MSRVSGISCEHCGIELKRQFMGSNLFYYCKRCGRITSETDISALKADCDTVGACV